MIEDAVRAMLKAKNEQLDRFCEMMLVDELHRGVLVEESLDGYSMRLSSKVPSMEIYVVRQ